MKLSRSYLAVAALTVATLFISTAGLAQQGPRPGPDRLPPEGRGMMRLGDAIGFIGFEEGLDGKTVTGAPFTANFTAQTTETLADGNRIQHSASGTLARDSQGRTRREMTLPAIGPWAAEGNVPLHIVFLRDPVAGTRYALEVDKKVARQLPPPPKKAELDRGFGAGAEQNDSRQVTTISLGKRVINGVAAEGTRITRTIPAGAIGNEKPITIVIERWYSPELQVNVLTKRSDPRIGDTVYQLTSIQRVEPSVTLFQVPSDYTIRSGDRAERRGRRDHSHGQRPQDGGPNQAPPPGKPPSESPSPQHD